MFKYISTTLLVAMLLTLSACFKKDTCPEIVAPVPTAAELENLKAFVENLDEEAIYDSRGFYYRIVKPGTNNHPGICSDIYSTWECTNGSGVVYYQSGTSNTYRVFDLSYQPYVWRMAFPMIGMSGEILIYAPPSLRSGYDEMRGAMHIGTSIASDANVVYRLSMLRYN